MKASGLAKALDERVGGAGWLNKAMRKVFPDHRTFLLGEIALYATTWFFRVAIFAGPVLGHLIAYRICLGLRERDRHTVRHGVETGVIVRGAHGGYAEIERPVTEEEAAPLLTGHDGHEPGSDALSSGSGDTTARLT